MTKDEKISIIIEDLQGTCLSIENILDRNDLWELNEDSDLYMAIDNELFECNSCGWWFELCEEAQVPDHCDRYCHSCAEDQGIALDE